MTNTLHAHVSTASSDCDGPQFDTYVVTFNDDEHAERERADGINDFSDINFMNRVFTNEAGPYAVMHSRIEVTDAGFSVVEDTEEGYRSAEVRWCHDDCDTDERTHRDVFAEQMDY